MLILGRKPIGKVQKSETRMTRIFADIFLSRCDVLHRNAWLRPLSHNNLWCWHDSGRSASKEAFQAGTL